MEEEEALGNAAGVEAVWAQQALRFAEQHWALLTSIGDVQAMKVTRDDSSLYQKFRQTFPKLKIDVVDEDELKAEEKKAKWRTFLTELSHTMDDYNFGTLLRTDVTGEYSPQNTMLVTRGQFYAIEVARNREGYNDKVAKG